MNKLHFEVGKLHFHKPLFIHKLLINRHMGHIEFLRACELVFSERS